MHTFKLFALICFDIFTLMKSENSSLPSNLSIQPTADHLSATVDQFMLPRGFYKWNNIIRALFVSLASLHMTISTPKHTDIYTSRLEVCLESACSHLRREAGQCLWKWPLWCSLSRKKHTGLTCWDDSKYLRAQRVSLWTKLLWVSLFRSFSL